MPVLQKSRPILYSARPSESETLKRKKSGPCGALLRVRKDSVTRPRRASLAALCLHQLKLVAQLYARLLGLFDFLDLFIKGVKKCKRKSALQARAHYPIALGSEERVFGPHEPGAFGHEIQL